MKNGIFILSVILIIFISLTAISASDDVGNLTSDDGIENLETSDESETLDSSDNEERLGNSSDIPTTVTTEDKNVVKGEDFTVKLSDNEGNSLSNKTISFTAGGSSSSSVTDANGLATLKIALAAGSKYAIAFLFAGDDTYAKSSGEANVFVVSSSTSKIKASDYTAYKGLKNTYTVTLTAGDTLLSGREIIFKVNGETYKRTTDSKGQATLEINLKAGTYTIEYYYGGENNINKTSGSSKITVKQRSPTTIKKLTATVFKYGYFKVKLLDARGNPIANKYVKFTLKGKTYTKKTNKNGIASLKISKKKGTYKIKVKFTRKAYYLAKTVTFKVKVKGNHPTNNGMWLFSYDMKSVSFKKLQKYGMNHIFLNYMAIKRFGKSYVGKWVQKANKYNIKVHIWMQIFYIGKWINPTTHAKHVKSKINEAKKYAKIKGIGGVHFDYLRYPGTAYKHKGGVKAISSFTKKAANAVHKINKKLIVSAAVMPEVSTMKHSYGQNIPTMSKYLDAIVPMVYKGNYHASSKWIKSVTKIFAKKSKKAQIWTGLQAYKSDSHVKKLSSMELTKDAKAAAAGGAKGVMLFRYTLFNYINFKKVSG